MTLTTMLANMNASAIEIEAVNEAVMTGKITAAVKGAVDVVKMAALLREVENEAECMLNRVRVLRARLAPPEVVYLTRLPDESPTVVKLA